MKLELFYSSNLSSWVLKFFNNLCCWFLLSFPVISIFLILRHSDLEGECQLESHLTIYIVATGYSFPALWQHLSVYEASALTYVYYLSIRLNYQHVTLPFRKLSSESLFFMASLDFSSVFIIDLNSIFFQVFFAQCWVICVLPHFLFKRQLPT